MADTYTKKEIQDLLGYEKIIGRLTQREEELVKLRQQSAGALRDWVGSIDKIKNSWRGVITGANSIEKQLQNIAKKEDEIFDIREKSYSNKNVMKSLNDQQKADVLKYRNAQKYVKDFGKNNIFDLKYESNGYFYTYDDDFSNPGTISTIEGAGFYPQAGINFLVGLTLLF
jgi:hypothetical protein